MERLPSAKELAQNPGILKQLITRFSENPENFNLFKLKAQKSLAEEGEAYNVLQADFRAGFGRSQLSDCKMLNKDTNFLSCTCRPLEIPLAVMFRAVTNTTCYCTKVYRAIMIFSLSC